MAGTGLLALLDDIAIVMDAVAVLTVPFVGSTVSVASIGRTTARPST